MPGTISAPQYAGVKTCTPALKAWRQSPELLAQMPRSSFPVTPLLAAQLPTHPNSRRDVRGPVPRLLYRNILEYLLYWNLSFLSYPRGFFPRNQDSADNLFSKHLLSLSARGCNRIGWTALLACGLGEQNVFLATSNGRHGLTSLFRSAAQRAKWICFQPAC